MKTVISVEGRERKVSKEGKPYTITHIMVSDGTEAEFYGDDIYVGDEVMIAFHWGKIKAIKQYKS